MFLLHDTFFNPNSSHYYLILILLIIFFFLNRPTELYSLPRTWFSLILHPPPLLPLRQRPPSKTVPNTTQTQDAQPHKKQTRAHRKHHPRTYGETGGRPQFVGVRGRLHSRAGVRPTLAASPWSCRSGVTHRRDTGLGRRLENWRIGDAYDIGLEI